MDFSGDEKGILPPWPSMSLLLEDVLERHGKLEAIVDGSKRLTFCDLRAQVASMAYALRRLGLEKGERVVLWGENGWRWEVSALACWWSGLVVVPLSNRLKSLEVLPLLQELSCAAIFAGRDNHQNNLLEGLRHFLDEQGATLEDSLPESRAFVDLTGESCKPFLSWDQLASEHSNDTLEACTAITPDDTCLILYTSGTTGKPKGVATRHGAILHSFMQFAPNSERPGDRMIVNTPLSHMYGQYNMVRGLMRGICQIIANGLVARDMAQIIREEKITLLSGPPSLFQQLLMQRVDDHTALHGVRKISTGGAPLSENLILEMSNSGVEVVEVGYGLTEYPRVCSSIPDDSIEHICTSVGRPLPGTRLKLVNEENLEVPAGQVGEILVSGLAMMQGYLGADGVVMPTQESGGWFHTGDLGRIIEGGFLQIVGRKKEMFISHGFNVYPAEVENLLLKSGLLESVAVISRKNRLSGEEGLAVIVPKKGIDFDLHQLRQWAQRNLADYKVPTRYILREDLPLNASGKIDKLALSMSYISGSEK